MSILKGPNQQIKVTLPSRGGFTGSSGTAGFTGSQGIQGTSGFTGSQGDLGYTGSQGAGFTGSQGIQGTSGFTGSQGDLGYTGSQGAGFTGSQGDTGFTGSEGNLDITTSSTPPAGAQYGDVWLDEATGIQYFYFNDGDTDQWVEFSNVGSQGYTGSRGNIGFTGSTGTGYTGSKGDLGYTGSKGNIGFVGSQGPIGYTGSQGLGSRVVTVPTTSTGAAGDLEGDLAFSNEYIYYCTADYGSGGNIWKRVAWSLDTW
jgi:hypothetical protein